ncbi:MAG: AmpG family muropeptide MFS transporter [Alphaproteobacteria bacterium]|nr:AmpG family muropeptide MFS transporter [Alphaproteobacteria bacterium]
MTGWFGSLAIYREPRLLAILLMGFSSGLPLALTGATLGVWLAEAGLSLTAIGLFALVGTAYNFKFVWSPLIDRLPLPVLTRLLGRRRGWAVLIQVLLGLAIFVLGLADPRIDPWWTALGAVAVAFLSASQDIVLDAYRVELLEDREQAAGAAATQVGYRFGMLAAGAGALYLATFFGWQVTYATMGALMAVGILTVLFTREPAATEALAPTRPGISGWIADAVFAPFADFVTRPNWLLILVFVVLYKLGDALAGTVSSPFYVAMGFSKIEIANISKIFGVVSTLVGVALGGVVTYRLGLLRGLMVCGVLQALSNLMFAIQAMVGYDVTMLMVTIATENITGGMGSAAFVAYLSSLCSVSYTATQYALLSSLAATARTMLSSSGGWLAETLGWVPFFGFTVLAAIPGLLLLIWLSRNIKPEPITETARA